MEFKLAKDRHLLVTATSALSPPLVTEQENPSAATYHLSAVPLSFQGPDGNSHPITVEAVMAEIKGLTSLTPRVIAGN